MTNRLPSVLAAFALALAPVAPAHADAHSQQISKLAKESKQLYDQGDYNGAASKLLDAYELGPVSTLLFNIAKTYEKAGNDEQAVRFYQRYVDAPDADPKLLRQATRALEKLHASLDQKKAQDAAAAADAEKKRQAELQAAQEKQRQAEEAQRQAEAQAALAKQAPPPPPPPKPSLVPGVAVTAVGVVALGVGAGLGASASKLASLEQASVDPVQKPQLQSQAIGRAHVTDIVYGAGAVVTAGGVALLAYELVGRSKAEAAAQQGDATAMLIPGGVMVAWTVSR